MAITDESIRLTWASISRCGVRIGPRRLLRGMSTGAAALALIGRYSLSVLSQAHLI